SYSEPLYLGMLLGGIRYALAKPPVPAVAPPPPRIRSFALSVSGRRIHASVRVVDCPSCRALLTVRSSSVRLRMKNGVATGTSGVLPPGRWRVTVTVANGGSDQVTGRTVIVRVR